MISVRFLTIIIAIAVLMGCQLETSPFAEEPLDSDHNTAPVVNANSAPVDLPSAEGEGEAVPATEVPDATTQATSVTLYWSAPLERVNGDSMAGTEIGGYEIRYKKPADAAYQNVLISEAGVDQHSFLDLSDADAYSFEVAVFDSDGIYSDFVIAMAN